MPGNPAPVAGEREGLLAFLAQQRYVIRVATYGLTDEQARAVPSASALSVGGIVQHVAATENGWIDTVLQQPQPPADDYGSTFRFGPDDTLAGVLAAYDDAARRTETVIADISDLGQPVPVPQGVPWFPDDIDAWSVRWVLLHLIEETARHAGHADLVREALDGATAFPLMAAAEGWPATPWLQPWSPRDR